MKSQFSIRNKFSQRIVLCNQRPTKRAVPSLRFGGWESARFRGIFNTLRESTSQAESSPAAAIPLAALGMISQAVGQPVIQKEIIVNNIPSRDHSYSKSTITVIGLIGGVIGAALGFVPFFFLHEFLGSLVNDTHVPRETFTIILFILAYGLGFPSIAALVVLPLGGAITGIIGAKIGTKRYLKKNMGNDRIRPVSFWWGLIFGFFYNLLVGFYNQ